MITWKKVGTALLVASLISSVLAPAAMAASKKKVGKIYLTIDYAPDVMEEMWRSLLPETIPVFIM